nr:heparanase-like protein 2 [Ipomoea batatas]
MTTAPWGLASVMNLDLSHPFLAILFKLSRVLRLRIGGSLQDQVVYDVGNLNIPCHPFRKQEDGVGKAAMGRENGILAMPVISLAIPYPRVTRYTHGNLVMSCREQVLVQALMQTYMEKDAINLNALLDELYKNIRPKPLLLAPGGFFDKAWFGKLLDVSGPSTVNALTHHIYNLGPGSDHNLVNKILNPEYLDGISHTFHDLTQTIQTNGPWASAWVGESGGAYNSGGHNVSNAFVNSFLTDFNRGELWPPRHRVFSSLIPDYYSALLWHRLMGSGVLAVKSDASPYLRSYAHCTKDRAGVTLLLINLSSQTEFGVDIQSTTGLHLKRKVEKKSFTHRLKETFSWVGSKTEDETLLVEEYHLTPEDGNVKSRTVLLNGTPLQLTETGGIPSMLPALRNVNSAISIAPLSIKFIVFPNLNAPGCR